MGNVLATALNLVYIDLGSLHLCATRLGSIIKDKLLNSVVAHINITINFDHILYTHSSRTATPTPRLEKH